MDAILDNIRSLLSLHPDRALGTIDGPDGQPILTLEIGPKAHARASGPNPSRWLEFRLEEGDQVLLSPRGQRLRMPIAAFSLFVTRVLDVSKLFTIERIGVHFATNETGRDDLLATGWTVIVLGFEVLTGQPNASKIRPYVCTFEIQTSKDKLLRLFPDWDRQYTVLLEPYSMQVHPSRRGWYDQHAATLHGHGSEQPWEAYSLPPIGDTDTDAPRGLPIISDMGHEFLVVVPAAQPPIAPGEPPCGGYRCGGAII